MSGILIVGELLRTNIPLVAVVPLDWVKAGRLPDNAPLPAILMRTISSVDRQPLKRGALVRTTDRIAVAVRAKSYADQVAIMKLIKDACAGKVGNFAGFSTASVQPAGVGPDVAGPGDSYEQTQDFRVSFDA